METLKKEKYARLEIRTVHPYPHKVVVPEIFKNAEGKNPNAGDFLFDILFRADSPNLSHYSFLGSFPYRKKFMKFQRSVIQGSLERVAIRDPLNFHNALAL